MPTDASRLYAKNVANLLALMTTDGTVVPDFEDDVIAGACLTHDGVVRHAPTAEALAALAGVDAVAIGVENAVDSALDNAGEASDASETQRASENEGVA
jgi:NAD(P) transhydrogenase subunit alpha